MAQIMHAQLHIPAFTNSSHELKSRKNCVLKVHHYVCLHGRDLIWSSVVQKPVSLQLSCVDDVETLKDSGEMANTEELFGKPKKGMRNPLVLCGAIATAGVLAAGLRSFQQGDSNRSQRLMRTRVAFQAATVALMVGTVFYQTRDTRNA